MRQEADITINGQKLTAAQSMLVRVALESFAMDLTGEGLGKDATELTAAYLARLREVRAVLYA